MTRRAVNLAFVALLALAPAAMLVGCDATAGDTTANIAAATAPTETSTGRRFTVPAAYFGSQDEATSKAALEEAGGTDIERNDDGSYTVTMSDANYEAFVNKDLTTTEQVLEAIPGAKGYARITHVTYNDALTEVTFTCSSGGDLGEAGENAASTAIYVCCLHQTIAGETDLDCTVTFKDPSGAVIASYTAQDFMS